MTEIEKKQKDAEAILDILSRYGDAEFFSCKGDGHIELDGVEFDFEDSKISRVTVPL